MILYHVSLTKIKPVNGKIPLLANIPEYAERSRLEDYKTPRVSFAPTIEQCLNALSIDPRDERFYVYPVNMKDYPEDLWYTPEKVYTEGNVVDALHTEEHWFIGHEILIDEQDMFMIDVVEQELQETYTVISHNLEKLMEERNICLNDFTYEDFLFFCLKEDLDDIDYQVIEIDDFIYELKFHY